MIAFIAFEEMEIPVAQDKLCPLIVFVNASSQYPLIYILAISRKLLINVVLHINILTLGIVSKPFGHFNDTFCNHMLFPNYLCFLY